MAVDVVTLALAKKYTDENSGGGSGTAGADGKSAYEIAVENGYIGTETEWLESLKGEDGKSAYEYAAEAGYSGTEEEFAEKLASSEIEIDNTLTIEGAAADAKATGDRLSTLESLGLSIVDGAVNQTYETED